MAIWAEQGQITSPASTGNQSYTFSGAGNGLVPKCIIFFASFIAAGSTGAHDWKMFGFTTGSTAARNQCHCFQNTDNQATQNLIQGFSETACIFKNDNNATTVDLRAVLQSFDTDGFTLNWTVTAAGISIQFIALGGDELEAFADNIDSGTGTGALTETGIPFEPKAIIAVWTRANTANETFASEDAQFGIGVAASSSQEWSWASGGDDGATANEFYGEMCNNAIFNYLTASSGAIDGKFDFTAFTSDGFTLNRSNAVSAQVTISYLALGGSIAVAAGTETAATSATTKSTNVGFPPDVLMFAGFNTTAADNDAMTAADRSMSLGFGVPSTGDSRACFWVEDNASDPTDTNAGASSTKCISIRSPTAIGTISAEADIDANSGNSFVLNWTTAGTAFLFGYLAIRGFSVTTIEVPTGSLTATGQAPAVMTTANQNVAVPLGTLTNSAFAPEVSDSYPYPVATGSLVTGASVTTLNVPYPAGVSDNDAILMVIGSNPGTPADPTTPTGWSLIANATQGNGEIFIYSKDDVDGTETGTLAVTVPANGQGQYAFMQLFRSLKAQAGGTWNISDVSTAIGSDNSIDMETVTAAVDATLAVAAMGVSQNNGGIAAATGESGGDWVETAGFDSGSHSSFSLSLQTAKIIGADISGGTATATSNRWAQIALALSVADPVTDVMIEVPAGSLTADGFAPAPSINTIVTVPVGELTATGFAPLSILAIRVTVPLGELTATGQVPTATATAHVSVTVPVAGLTATGLAPPITLTTNYNETIPAGSLAADGFAPVSTATAHISVTVPVAELTMTPYEPDIVGPDNCPKGVTFDGTTWLSRGANLDGIGDGPFGSLSFWVRFDADGVDYRLFFGGGNLVRITRISDGTLSVRVLSSGGAQSFSFTTVETVAADGSYHNILISWDTNHAAGSKLCHVVIGDVPATLSTSDASVAFDVDYTGGDWFIGTDSGGSDKLSGDLADLWFTDEYLDFSVEANRRKFITASGGAEYLGPDGSTPTGNQPVLFLRGPATSFPTNLGTGGNFTVTGTLTDAATDPPCGDEVLITVPAGELTAAAFAPAVAAGANVLIEVPAGSLTADSFAPLVLNTFQVTVPTGSLTGNSFAPAITATANRLVEVPTGQLTETAFAPAADIDVLVAVPVGSLVMTGRAPVAINTSDGDDDDGPRGRKFLANVGTLIGPA